MTPEDTASQLCAVWRFDMFYFVGRGPRRPESAQEGRRVLDADDGDRDDDDDDNDDDDDEDDDDENANHDHDDNYEHNGNYDGAHGTYMLIVRDLEI